MLQTFKKLNKERTKILKQIVGIDIKVNKYSERLKNLNERLRNINNKLKPETLINVKAVEPPAEIKARVQQSRKSESEERVRKRQASAKQTHISRTERGRKEKEGRDSLNKGGRRKITLKKKKYKKQKTRRIKRTKKKKKTKKIRKK